MKKQTFIILLLGLLLGNSSAEAQNKAKNSRRDRARSHVTVQPRLETLPVTVQGERFEMVLVRGGSYMMGCNIEFMRTNGKQDEVPRHGVSLNSFYIGRYEVTQRLWKTVMGYNPSNFVGDDLPVEQVSYYEVMAFIERLNELTGMSFRLPTEAEWEYAARGGNESQGYRYAGSDKLMQVSWAQVNSGDSTHLVGGLVPNELGLYDMTGNVWEWCSDWYDKDAYIKYVAEHFNIPTHAKDRESLSRDLSEYRLGMDFECVLANKNPQGPASGELKVGRGGSWTDEEVNMRVFYRNFWPPDRQLSMVGFRLALTADSVPASGWMPNQHVIDSMVGNKLYSSMTTEGMALLANGVLEGVFSVSPTEKVRFSKGNLQYNAVADLWRFAENQYDIIGIDNIYLDKTYAGWIDLFAFGTSGYRGRTPYYFASVNTKYGNGSHNLDGTSYDWGVNNAITNGGNRVGRWRTLSVYEWAYLLLRRPNAQLLAAAAEVNGHQGMILLPDNWLEEGGDTLQPNIMHRYTQNQWSMLERAGVVFLPCAGYAKFAFYYYGVPLTPEAKIPGVNTGFGMTPIKTAVSVKDPAKHADEPDGISTMTDDWIAAIASYQPPLESDEGLGYYWTTVQYDKNTAMGFCFYFGSMGFILPLERLTRLSVRLVQDVK